MAYIRRLPSGKFQATVYHPSGKRVTRTDALKRTVQAWARDKETEFQSGAGPVGGGRLTIEAWWARWSPTRGADFQGSTDVDYRTTGGDNIMVIGWVDAQNSFGAKLRSNFTCSMDVSKDGTASAVQATVDNG